MRVASAAVLIVCAVFSEAAPRTRVVADAQAALAGFSDWKSSQKLF